MSEEKPSYFSVIPATVRYDRSLKPNEKLLYSEITALTNKTGECYATNNYFSKLYEVHKNTISLWIQNLKVRGYIDIDFKYKKDTKELEKRVIKVNGVPINKNIDTYQLNDVGGINEILKDNNTSINNSSSYSINNKDFYENNFGTLSDYIESTIIYLENQFGKRKVFEAMKVAVTNNKRNLNYVKGILKNWKDKSIEEILTSKEEQSKEIAITQEEKELLDYDWLN